MTLLAIPRTDDDGEDETQDIAGVLHGVREWGPMRDHLPITKAEAGTLWTFRQHIESIAQKQGRDFEHEETVRYIKRYKESEQRVAELEKELKETQREVALLRKEQAARRSKKWNTVDFEVTVSVSDTERFGEVLKAEYGTEAGKEFRVTLGQFRSETDFWCHITYGPVRGVHPSDVHERFKRVAKLSGTELLSEPVVTTLSRVVHE